VIAAIIVRLPFLDRPAAIPVLAKLVVKGTNSKSRLWLAARMAHMIADAFPGRETGVVADSAYAGAELKKLPARITSTTRLRKDAALCELPPRRTGKPRPAPRQGRPAPQPGQTRRHSHLAAGDRDPALHRRHGRQAPPRYHRRPFSPISPRPANTRRNTPHPPGLGRPRRITAKVEVYYRLPNGALAKSSG
jgi:hypothetical protein